MTSKIIASGQRSEHPSPFGGPFKILASGEAGVRCVRILGQCTDDAEVGSLDSEFDALSGRVDNLEDSAAAVSSQISVIESDVAALDSEVASQAGQITTITGDIDTIDGQITTITGDIATINDQITALTTRVSALEAQALTAVRLVHREIADLFVSDSTTLTPLLTYTIPQGTIQGGDVFRIVVAGNYLNNTGANAIFDIRFTVNTTDELWNASATFPAAAGAHGFWVELDFAIHPDELQFLNGIVIIGNEAPPTTGIAGNLEVVNTIAGLEGTPGIIALTQDLELQVQFQHNVASANLILTRRAAWVERLGVAA